MNEISRSHSSSTKISQVESERRWSFFRTHFQKLLLRCWCSLTRAHFLSIFERFCRANKMYTNCWRKEESRECRHSQERRGTEVVFSFHISFIIPFIYASSRNDCMRCSLTRFSFAKKNREHSNLTTLFITTHSPIYARDRMIMRKISNFTRTAKRNNLNTKHITYIRHECPKLILIGTMMMMWNIVNAEGIGRFSHVRWDHEMFHIIDSGLTGSRGCGTGWNVEK